MVHSGEDLETIQQACAIAATVLDELCRAARPGVTTLDLDRLGRDLIHDMGATSACHGYRIRDLVYPAYTCLSVNEEVVHGIGRLDRELREGDNLSIDVSVRYRGFIGDNARTVLLEPVSSELLRLNEVTLTSLEAGIREAVPGNRVGDISHAVQRVVEKAGFSVVRQFVGHGIGRSIHEEPQIPNYGRRRTGPVLREGMVLAIEPMVNAGSEAVDILPDGWTAVTRDRRPACHFEHSVLLTRDGPEILTVPDSSLIAAGTTK